LNCVDVDAKANEVAQADAGKIRGKATRGNELSFSEYGLVGYRAGLAVGVIEAGRAAASRNAPEAKPDPRVPAQVRHQEAGRDPNGN
jgi:hypothetical protein